MSRPSLAPVAAVLLIGLAAPMAPAQPPDPGAPAAADPNPMASARTARHLLRNGQDYLSYKQYERALAFFREAEARQKELTESERVLLRKAIQRARIGMREPEPPDAPEVVAHAGRGRTMPRPPATFALARPTPDPEREPEREPILLTSATVETPAGRPRADVAPAPPALPEPIPVVAPDPVESAAPSGLPPLPEPAEPLAPPPPLSATSLPEEAPTPAPAVRRAASAPAPLPAPLPAPAPAPVAAPAPAPAPASIAPAPPEPPLARPVAEPTLPPTPAPPPAAAPEVPIVAAQPDRFAPESSPPPPQARPTPEAVEIPPLPEEADVVAPRADMARATAAPAAEPPAPAEAVSPAPAPADAASIPGPSATPMPAPAEAPAPPIASAPAIPPLDDPSPAPPASSPIALPELPPEAPASIAAGPGPAAEPAPSAVGDRPYSVARTTLSEESNRQVEEMMRRQEARRIEEVALRQGREDNVRRDAPPPGPPPTAPRGAGEPGLGADVQTNRLELPRAPSPTEARPIRPIPVPDEITPLAPRQWDGSRKAWVAAATCHGPLYFQDAVLERYGQSIEQVMGPAGRFMSFPLDDPRQSNQRQQIAQPFVSLALFYGQIIALPYNLIVDPPGEAEYDLGYHRPGDLIPPDTYYLPWLGVGPPLRGKHY